MSLLFKKIGLLSGLKWENFQWFSPAFQQSQLPMNYTPGRFVKWGTARGVGFGLSATDATGLSVFDFNSAQNEYRLTRFTAINVGGTVYAGQAMVNDTTFIALKDNASNTDDAYRAVVTIDAAGVATLVAAYADAGNMNCTYSDFQSLVSAGFNNNVYWGYYRGATGGYGTTNGWLDKATVSSYTAMSGALCTGYSGAEPSQGQPGLSLAVLGYAAPNGYLVVSSTRDDGATVVRFNLVNAAGTPAPGVECSWSGRSNTFPAISLSARRVAVPYDASSSYLGRMALLYTDSDASPTTLTKGADCAVPTIPVSSGFGAADVDDLYGFGGSYLVNYKSKENKILTCCYWKIKAASAGGDHSYYVYAPVVVESTSTSNISAAIPSVDIKGNATVLVHATTATSYFSFWCAGAPDSKAVFMWIGAANSTLYNADKLYQQTFQL